MKGFGKSDYSEAISRLRKAALSESEDILNAMVKNLISKHGSETVADLFIQVISSLPKNICEWALVRQLEGTNYINVRKRVLEEITQALIKKEWVLGKDFSITNSRILIKSEILETLLLDIHPSFKDVVRQYFVQFEEESPQSVLEKHLGVPFVKNIVSQMLFRLPYLSDSAATAYIGVCSAGVYARTQVELFPIFIQVIKQRYPSRYEGIMDCVKKEDLDLNHPVLVKGLLLVDLVVATGGDAEIRGFENGNIQISTEGLRLLSLVYEGDRLASDWLVSLQ